MDPSNVIWGPGELLQSEKPTAACTCTGIVKVLAASFCACAGKAYARPTDIAMSTLLFIPMVLFFWFDFTPRFFPHRSMSAALGVCPPQFGSNRGSID